MNEKNAIQRACDVVGGQANLARAIGVTPSMVNQWGAGLRPIPLDRCVDIERATGKQVTCEELRPDKAEYWAYLRAASEKEAA